MSILSVGELPTSPTATFEVGKFTFTRQFLVTCNSYNDGPLAVTAAGGIPLMYSSYTFGGAEHYDTARLRKLSAKRVEPNSFQWVVDCEYSTPENKESSATGKDGGGGTGTETPGQQTDPTLELPTIKTWTIEKEEPLYSVLDYTGCTYNTGTQTWVPLPTVKFPQSSACEIFDPPYMIRKTTLGFSVSRNEDLSSPIISLCGTYQNSTNSDWFFGAAPGTMLCKTITVERQTRQVPGGGPVPFLKTDYQFEYKGEGWVAKLLDHGSYFRCGGVHAPCGSGASGSGSGSGACGGTVRKFLTDDGHPRQGLLDGNGGKLADGLAPVFITIQGIYKSLPFAALNLPSSFYDVQ